MAFHGYIHLFKAPGAGCEGAGAQCQPVGLAAGAAEPTPQALGIAAPGGSYEIGIRDSIYLRFIAYVCIYSFLYHI